MGGFDNNLTTDLRTLTAMLKKKTFYAYTYF